MTATDGEITEDSLDINDPIDYLNSENILENDKLPKPVLQPVPVSPKTPSTAKQQTPPTAKNETKFTFDLDPQKIRDDSTPKAVSKNEHLFTFEKHTGSEQTNRKYEEKSVEKLMDEQIEALKLEAKRRNSYRVTAQPDFDKIEVMVDVNERSQSPKEHRRSFRRKLDIDKEKHENASPKRRAERGLNSSPENEMDSPKPKHRWVHIRMTRIKRG